MPTIEIKVLKRLINETSFVTKDATQVASVITTDTYGGVLICCDGSCLDNALPDIAFNICHPNGVGKIAGSVGE